MSETKNPDWYSICPPSRLRRLMPALKGEKERSKKTGESESRKGVRQQKRLRPLCKCWEKEGEESHRGGENGG